MAAKEERGIMTIDWKNFFKAEDFHFTRSDVEDGLLEQSACDLANQKLWAAIQTAEKVTGTTKDGEYHGAPIEWCNEGNYVFPTHEARIVDVRKL